MSLARPYFTNRTLSQTEKEFGYNRDGGHSVLNNHVAGDPVEFSALQEGRTAEALGGIGHEPRAARAQTEVAQD